MWGPVSSSPPPSTQTGERPGRRTELPLPFLLSPLRRLPPPVPSDEEIQKLRENPWTPALGVLGLEAGSAQGGARMCREGCVCARLKGGGRFPSSSALGRKRKADFL